MTHEFPDPDAILSIWLLTRFGEKMFPGSKQAELVFVSAQNGFEKDNSENVNTIAVDVVGGHFDHHGSERSEKCSALLLAEHLGVSDNLSLVKILHCVNQLDTTGKISSSKIDPTILLFSLFEMIKGWHIINQGNHAETVRLVCNCFDAMYAAEGEWIQALEDIKSAIVFEGIAIKIVAVASSSKAIMKAGRLAQGNLVIAQNPNGNIGIVVAENARWQNPDLTDLAALLRLANCCATKQDYKVEDLFACENHHGWFLHASRQILSHGSDKAIAQESLPYRLEETAAMAAHSFFIKSKLPDTFAPVLKKWSELVKSRKSQGE